MAEGSRGNIQTFTSPVDQLRPADEGARALSESAYTEGKLYRQAGEDYKQAGATLGDAITQHEYMDEVAGGSAAWSALFNNKTAEWNQLAAQPGAAQDKNLQDKFINDSLEPALQKFQNAFSTEQGQKWALSRVDEMRQHFYEKSSADMSNLAGEKRVQDFKTTLNQLSATAYKDPTSTDAVLAHVDETLKAVTENADGRMTAEQLSKFQTLASDMKNEIVKNTIKGIADNLGDAQGPSKAKALLDSGTYDKYIPANEQAEMHKYIEMAQRVRRDDQDHAYIQQKRAQEQKDETFSNKVIDQLKPDENTGVLSIPPNMMSQIFQAQGISAKTKMETMSAVNHAAKETAIDDPGTVRSLYAGVGNGTTTQQSALQALAVGKITPQTYDQINSIVKGTDAGRMNGISFGQTMKVIKTQVSGEDQIPGMKDPKGEENYAKALPAVSAAYQAGLAKGVPENELLDPSDKNWIGNAAKPFVRDQQTWYTDMAAANLGAGPMASKDQDYIAAAKADKLTMPQLQAAYKQGLVSKQTTQEIAISKGWVSGGSKQSNTPSVPRPE